ncbi:hypothetical protein DFQ26_008901, partial [Actinomortierella ambigua]
QLYSDPLRYYTINPHVILRGLLFLSPTNDKDIQVVRQALDAPLRADSDPPLMLDYLQYIRFFNIRRAYDDGYRRMFNLYWLPHSQQTLPSHSQLFALQYAIVGRHLSNLSEFGIVVNDVEQCLQLAPRLSSLATIVILGCLKGHVDQVKDLILAIQRHQGASRLTDCRFQEDHRGPIDSNEAIQVLSVLPPLESQASLTFPRTDGSPTILDRPMDHALARLIRLVISEENGLIPQMKTYYPSLTISQIMQRCRAVRRMEVEVSEMENKDLFSWAPYEAEQQRQQQPQRNPFKLVDLTILQLKVHAPISGDDTLYDTNVWILKPVDDALRGFAHSLKELTLRIGGVVPLAKPEWEIPLPCPLLRSLQVVLPWGVVLDASTWDRVPKLEVLTFDVIFPQRRWWPLGSPGSLDPGSGLRIRHQALKKIFLNDGAVAIFDPASLEDLPSLEDLYVRDENHVFGDNTSNGTLDSDNSPSTSPSSIDQASPCTLFPWTWTWSLPSLKQLDLHVDLSIINFEFSILHDFPSLSSLTLRHPERARPFHLNIKRHVTPGREDYQDPVSASSDQQQPQYHQHHHQQMEGESTYMFPNLSTLDLHGPWIITANELSHFTRALPGLQYLFLHQPLEFSNLGEIETYTDKDLVAMTRHHTKMRMVRAQLSRWSEAKELGLFQIPEDRSFGENWEGARYAFWSDINYAEYSTHRSPN